MAEPLVVIVGPTASGKSSFAMQIAKKFNGEIICADSRTVYKGMDIGTAKPSKNDQAEVRHHLLDVVEPNQPFTAAEFKRLANRAIKDISSRGKLPVMVGGSGLYVDSVLFDFDFGKPADQELRRTLSDMTVQELQDLCRRKNIELPENSLNKRYLVRAIEVGGQKHEVKKLRPDTIVVGLTTKKESLRSKIEKRAYQMVDEGVVEEVSTIGGRYGWESEAMKSNIFRVFKPVVEDHRTLDEGLAAFVQSDLNLAKKQLTWFKRNLHIHWGEPKELATVIEQFVSSYKNQLST